MRLEAGNWILVRLSGQKGTGRLFFFYPDKILPHQGEGGEYGEECHQDGEIGTFQLEVRIEAFSDQRPYQYDQAHLEGHAGIPGVFAQAISGIFIRGLVVVRLRQVLLCQFYLYRLPVQIR